MADVVVFAPSPLLTVTLEDEAGSADIHVHAGGQGVWQARMLRTLGRDVAICAALIGETGRAVRHLLEDEGIEVHAVERAGHGAAYVHDRRAGQREPVAELPGDALTRHDLDELYAVVLREAMNARVVLLSGPATDGVLPDDVYRRLAADLAAAGIPVVADLAGTRLAAALAGGVHVAKVSQDELVDAGAVTGTSVPELVAAARRLRQAGAHNVVVTRSDRPALLVEAGSTHAVRVPAMEEVDVRGAGDSFTAALVAALADGEPLHDAVRIGVAAGALNVTRHGLGTGDAEAIRRLREHVELVPLDDDEAEMVTLDELASRTEVDRP
ncbi:PfkB family carbohydrate kinase [Agromyces sp. H66]|uniref:1-phosphofructokinase family hexose kinase n=1 Tax=Agromyces sp. H66 TaxID=2529859 RepID=UPI001B7D8B9B|nr:PfkB family carbohydrate kinase [Agromyces sp. H66]